MFYAHTVRVFTDFITTTITTTTIMIGDDGSMYTVTSPFAIDGAFALGTGLLVQRCLAGEIHGPQVGQRHA